MFGFGKRVSREIFEGAALGGSMTDTEFLEREIEQWRESPNRQMMITGQLYYEGEQDILLQIGRASWRERVLRLV